MLKQLKSTRIVQGYKLEQTVVQYSTHFINNVQTEECKRPKSSWTKFSNPTTLSKKVQAWCGKGKMIENGRRKKYKYRIGVIKTFFPIITQKFIRWIELVNVTKKIFFLVWIDIWKKKYFF